MINEKKR
jgi:hypothetical protein